jgi:hypothetical protein
MKIENARAALDTHNRGRRTNEGSVAQRRIILYWRDVEFDDCLLRTL